MRTRQDRHRLFALPLEKKSSMLCIANLSLTDDADNESETRINFMWVPCECKFMVALPKATLKNQSFKLT